MSPYSAFLRIGAAIARAGCCDHSPREDCDNPNRCTRESLMCQFLELRREVDEERKMSMPPGSKRPLADLEERMNKNVHDLAKHWRDIAHATQEQLDAARAENKEILAAFHKLREELAQILEASGCDHDWIDPSNERVIAGTWRVCSKCGRLEDRKGDGEVPEG